MEPSGRGSELFSGWAKWEIPEVRVAYLIHPGEHIRIDPARPQPLPPPREPDPLHGQFALERLVELGRRRGSPGVEHRD